MKEEREPLIARTNTTTCNLRESVCRIPKEVLEEALTLCRLAVPALAIELGAVVPPFLTASYVGRAYGPRYLDGFTLASLTGNLFTLSVIQGLFSASDTLGPQAYGAKNYREVGLLAIRGFFVSILVLLSINLCLYFCMGWLLVCLGIDATVARHAWRWYQVYTLCLPFYALYQAIWRFCSAQSLMIPCLFTAVFSSGFILPTCLLYFSELFGFMGSSVAIAVFQSLEAFLLLGYLAFRKPYDTRTWPGVLSWQEALRWDRLSLYLSLGTGGIVATSEWIYWETVSLMIGTLGVYELSVHTIPTQFLTVTYAIPFGIGTALSIRIGVMLSTDVNRAKRLALTCWIFSFVAISLGCFLCYQCRYAVYSLFTADKKIIAGADEIWPHVTVFMFLLQMFGINGGIVTGLGMQWSLGAIAFFWLWIMGLPVTYCFGIVRQHSLLMVWQSIWPPYVAMNLLLIYLFLSKDWQVVATTIRKREQITGCQTEPSRDG